MSDRSLQRLHVAIPVLLAVGLLAMTLAWHLPMMLWDHLDLVPLLQAAEAGSLGREFWQLHGGHWHAAAYALLLATAMLSAGQPWLDCLLSWMLLVAFALGVQRLAADARTAAARSTDAPAASAWWLLLPGLALYPGHLANLQWGWQVAVFVCLLGVVVTLFALTRARLDWRHNGLALAASLLALASFATAIALVPTVLVLLALRSDLSRRQRLLAALPWLLLAGLLAAYYARLSLHAPSVAAGPGTLLVYVLNFLGAGIARFATTLAPVLAAAALLLVLLRLPSALGRRHCLPWLGFMLFAGLAAVAVAFGRAGDYGAGHAFATRYVSFSSLFWLGFVGLLLDRDAGQPTPRWLQATLAGVLLFAVVNAVQMGARAARLAAEGHATAGAIRASYPQVDEALLRAIYFDQPEIARERLQHLHERGYPPFAGVDLR